MLRPLPSHSVRRERRCGDRMVHDNVASAERGMLLRLLDEEVIEQNVGTGGRVQTVYEQADVSRLERRILSFDNLLTVDVEGQRIAYALASDMDMGRKNILTDHLAATVPFNLVEVIVYNFGNADITISEDHHTVVIVWVLSATNNSRSNSVSLAV